MARSKASGSPDAEPLSVFLDQGVVPRSEREDNHNQLGADLSKYLLVRPGDLVFNKLRTWQGGFGASRFDGIVSPAYFVLQGNPEVDSRYVDYLLHSAPYLAELTRLSKWMPPSQFDLAWEDLRDLPIPLPPLEEQRRIANYLDDQTARIDQAIQLRQQQVVALTEKELAEIDEGLLSASDSLVRLSWVATVRSGITLNARHEAEFGGTYVPYLRVANVKADRLDLTEVKGVRATKEQLARYALRRGDVLMTEGGDRDKLGRGTMWREEIAGALHQNHVFAIRCRDRVLMPEFLALLTRTTLARRYFESTANQSTNLASTSAANVGAWRIPLPAPQEQAGRLNRVHNSISAAQRQRKLLLTSADLLLQKRNSIIANSVTGGPVPIE